VVASSDWKNKFKQLPEGRGVGIACGAYLCGAGLPIYWNKMPQSGVQLLIDRSGQVTVFCGATEIGQGRTTCSRRSSPKCSHRRVRRALRHRRHRLNAGGPRLVFQPSHGDDGQRRDPGASACAI